MSHPDKEYEYETLPNEGSIRLLELEPEEAGDSLKCRLSVVNISEQPHYEALSYVWGDPLDRTEIACDGKRMSIPKTLATALKRFRQPSTRRILWADAICINQNDTPERNQQVTLMGKIYSSADCVLAWIGFEYSETYAKLAFDLILRIIRELTARIPEGETYVDIPQLDENDPLLNQSASWMALEEFVCNPYFERAWIQQEIGLAKQAVIYWGTQELYWHRVGILMLYMSSNLSRFAVRLPSSKTLYNSWALYTQLDEDGYLIENKAPEGTHTVGFLENFWNVLGMTRNLNASDPRDVVYAFLAHPTAQFMKNPYVKADYQLTADEVINEVAVIGLFEEKNPLVLSHAGDSVGPQFRSLPSWVPDLSRPASSPVFGNHDSEYGAGLSMRLSAVLSDCRKKISLSGVFFDEIVEHTDMMSVYDFDIRQPTTVNGVSKIHPLKRMLDLVERSDASLSYPKMSPYEILSILAIGGKDDAVSLEQHLYNLGAYCKSLESINIDIDADRGDFWAFEFGVKRCHKRDAFRTKEGFVGLGPMTTQIGDVVVVIFGAHVPFILRPEGEHYLLVGESYVLGIMDGEVIDIYRQGKVEKIQFEIH